MAKFLMTLRDVPDDEADDIRALLDAASIAYYETKPSLWGVSGGGFWIVDDERIVDAKARLAEYQTDRARRVRAEREADRAAGRLDPPWAALRRNPLQALAALLGIVLMIALTLLPFVLLRG
jgi:hypothetical protein